MGKKGPLSGYNLLYLGLLAAGVYVGYKYVLPVVQGKGLPPGRVRDAAWEFDHRIAGSPSDFKDASPAMLDKFGRPPSKLRGPPSGLDPYSGVSNDGAPTVYQDDWVYGRL